jgi:hypothetical protein
MCAEARTVLRAVAADLFFNCWYLQIASDNRIRHIPRCVHYHALMAMKQLEFTQSGKCQSQIKRTGMYTAPSPLLSAKKKHRPWHHLAPYLDNNTLDVAGEELNTKLSIFVKEINIKPYTNIKWVKSEFFYFFRDQQHKLNAYLIFLLLTTRYLILFGYLQVVQHQRLQL